MYLDLNLLFIRQMDLNLNLLFIHQFNLKYEFMICPSNESEIKNNIALDFNSLFIH